MSKLIDTTLKIYISTKHAARIKQCGTNPGKSLVTLFSISVIERHVRGKSFIRFFG